MPISIINRTCSIIAWRIDSLTHGSLKIFTFFVKMAYVNLKIFYVLKIPGVG